MSQVDDLYAPPEADDEPEREEYEDRLVLATQGKRFVNFVVDSIASRVAGVIAIVITQGSPLFGVFLSVSSVLGYYVLCELAFQATLGKLMTGTRVVAANGGKPTFWQIVGRTFSRFVPFEPFSLLGDKRPTGWHDRWSGTLVVKRESLRES